MERRAGEPFDTLINEGIDIKLNGQSLGIAHAGSPNDFGGLSTFTLSGPGLYQSGSNELSFVLNNAGNDPSQVGLLVEFTSVTGSVQAIPVPATFGLLGFGLVGLGAYVRRRSITRLER